jgi:hypothetical protein
MRARLHDAHLRSLIQAAPAVTAAERERQVVSLAYGNAKLENDRITRPLVEDAHAKSRR